MIEGDSTILSNHTRMNSCVETLGGQLKGLYIIPRNKYCLRAILSSSPF